MKKILLKITVFTSLAVAVSCNNTAKKNIENTGKKDSLPLTLNGEVENGMNEKLIGTWLEPNPINAAETQGFELSKDGGAKSVNMATLLYKKWWVKNNELVLVEESIGNGNSSIDTMTYKILKLDEKHLSIKKGEASTIDYTKK